MTRKDNRLPTIHRQLTVQEAWFSVVRQDQKAVARIEQMPPFYAGYFSVPDMGDYRRLEVWKKAHALSVRVDQIAASIRSARHRPLRNQMMRSAGSVPANIVEGCGQDSAREFRRFLSYALNSANETDYHLLAARDFRLISSAEYNTLSERITEVSRMLSGLKKYLKSVEDAPMRNPRRTSSMRRRNN